MKAVTVQGAGGGAANCFGVGVVVAKPVGVSVELDPHGSVQEAVA